MRVGRLDVVVHLDVGELGPPDHPLLLLDRQGIPGGHVVQVLLHDDVAPAGEGRILGPDGHRRLGCRTGRVLGPVDEAEQVPLVEVPEPVDLVDHRDGTGQPADNQGGQLPAQIHRCGPDVEQEVTRGGHSPVPTAVEGQERVELGRPGAGEEAIPRRRSQPRHDGQPALRGTEADRPGQSGEVGQQVADDRLTALVDRQDEDDGAGRQRGEHGLRRRRPGDGRRALWDCRHERSPVSPLRRSSNRRTVVAQGSVPHERSGGIWPGGRTIRLSRTADRDPEASGAPHLSAAGPTDC